MLGSDAQLVIFIVGREKRERKNNNKKKYKIERVSRTKKCDCCIILSRCHRSQAQGEAVNPRTNLARVAVCCKIPARIHTSSPSSNSYCYSSSSSSYSLPPPFSAEPLGSSIVRPGQTGPDPNKRPGRGPIYQKPRSSARRKNNRKKKGGYHQHA